MKNITFERTDGSLVSHDDGTMTNEEFNEFILTNLVKKIHIEGDFNSISFENVNLEMVYFKNCKIEELSIKNCKIGGFVNDVNSSGCDIDNFYINNSHFDFFNFIYATINKFYIFSTFFRKTSFSLKSSVIDIFEIGHSTMDGSDIIDNKINTNFKVVNSSFDYSWISCNSVKKVKFLNVSLYGVVDNENILLEENQRLDINGMGFVDCRFNNKLVPETGSFIGWKKIRLVNLDYALAKLLIYEDSLRVSSTTYKCRCNKAKVLSITSLDETENFESGVSIYDPTFVYKVGEDVESDSFNTSNFTCTNGIHFFIDKQNAKRYI